MAKKKKSNPPSNSGSQVETNSFSKGMQKDIYSGLVPKEQWGHARNAANNSVDGDIGIIGNEPANIECAKVPYTIIGAIHRYGDQWVIFSTDDTSSEIGLFDDSKCEYDLLVNDPCLNFNRKYLITGASKENYDCTWQIYWDDGNNPSRTLNIDDIPYIQEVVSAPGADCILYEDTSVLNCEKIRLAPLMDVPCVKLTKAKDGGQLRNGSYRAYIAYTVNEQKVTDYIGVSNIQALFSHDINGGSLDIEISNLDKNFEYYELVILSDNQGQKDARKIGIYSTEQFNISIDFIDPALTAIGVELLFSRSPAYEKSESMYVVNDWLIRQGPTEQFDFNYQPLANKITTNWVVAEYDANYYFKGGNETQFMRDEVYSFFIRWIYNTGEKSSSYHIPGRPPSASAKNQFQQSMSSGGDIGTAPGISLGDPEYNFQIFNTAEATQAQGGPGTPTGNGGTIIQRGTMAYWQSTEKYPATKPEIWDSSYVDPITGVNIGDTSNPNFDLCGKEIRHHKMPTEETHPSLHLSAGNGSTIRLLGVEFSDITRPRYNDGTYIENIAGYEILRGSREGAKSILAKGLFRNMREYEIPDQDGNTLGPTKGLYPNFPYNDLRDDVYHYDGSRANQSGNFGGSGPGYNLFAVDPLPRTDGCADGLYGPTNNKASLTKFPPLTGFRRDVFTFHSPELMFRKPFLNPYEIRIYGAVSGVSEGHFIKSEKHPQNKLLRNAGALIAGILGTGYAINQLQGTQETVVESAENAGAPYLPAWVMGGFGSSGSNFLGYNSYAAAAAAAQGANSGANSGFQIALQEATKLTDLFGAGGATSDGAQKVFGIAQAAIVSPGMVSGDIQTKYVKDSDTSGLNIIFKALLGFINSGAQIAIGAQKVIDLLYNLVSPEDFAYKHNSAGLFANYHKTREGTTFRARNNLSNYIGNVFQNFNPNSINAANNTLANQFKINNLFRPDTVAIQSHIDLPIPNGPNGLGAPADRSRYVIGGDSQGNADPGWMANPEGKQYKPISALYGALKFNFENQYGQLDGIKQVVMNDCIYEIDLERPERALYSTGPIFTGDTYVGRYSEKVIMPIFSDFLLGQPDQFPYNYLQRINIPYPRYWMDTRKFDTSKWANLLNIIGQGILGTGGAMQNLLPNDLFYLDRGENNCVTGLDSVLGNDDDGNSLFAMKVGAMYTHCNGVLDFFVESEINLANRDWDNTPQGRHYDNFRYQAYDEMFHAEIVKEDNVYKYDYSLSASRFLTNLTKGAGNVQPRDYNPQIAETCFSHYPKRLIYSLQSQKEAKKDFWRVFLVNNYRDFKNPVNVIKPINKNGAIIFFPYQSPQMFQGIDTLETTDYNTKITIGDGGLFSQPFQNLVNSDISNEYGSCESQRGVINTPYGFFFISQAQGKVFQQKGQGLNAISNNGMKWWFNKYLPSNLIRQFPELEFSELADNTVIGVGCQITYDITDDIMYVCKKDFELKEEWLGQVIFDTEEDCFVILDNISNPNDSHSIPAKSVFKTTLMYVCPDCNTLVGGFANGITTFDASDQQGCFDAAEKGCGSDVPPPTPVKTCIDIGDPLYFDDCSWTVSYDPKVEAWISFHDWHPELCLSSINHFLTTKTGITDDPQCPPNFVYNSVTGNCERLIDETVNAVVSVDEIPTVGEGCPDGFTFNPISGECENIVIFDINCAGSEEVVAATPSAEYGKFGARFYTDVISESSLNLPVEAFGSSFGTNNTYELQYSNGTTYEFDNFQSPPIVPVNPYNNPLWSGAGGRLNAGGVWTGLPNDGNGCFAPPCGEWIGFTQCIELPATKTYCVGIAADNQVRFTINGTIIVHLDGNDGRNFYNWHVIPIALNAGVNIITLEGYNQASIASFAAEIYDATPLELANMTTVAELEPVIVFSTENTIDNGFFQVGETVGCDCPNGGVLSNCTGELQCVEIETSPLVSGCDCPEGYTLVYWNQVEQNFTLPTGDCIDDEIPPICRKVECICPPGPDPDSIVTQSGTCDNVYLAGPNGDLTYVNPDPARCTFNALQEEPANFKIGGIWRHNYRCDLFANYYNVDYPWEVELIESTGQNVFTVRSLEYQLESYVYKGDLFNGCSDDRWHDLDFNFDESIIYNTEQVSGLLKLNLDPVGNPLAGLTYPIINSNDIDILYSKVEQKYRFNQFWDVTNDRGEFTNAEQEILMTQCNGYIRDLNSANLNYNKAQGQRKKFRHYYNKIILRRVLSNNRKMLLKLNNTKLNLSYR